MVLATDYSCEQGGIIESRANDYLQTRTRLVKELVDRFHLKATPHCH